MIRYYCLRGKTKAQIITKPEQGYHQDALCLRTVEKWAARFRAGWEAVEDDERPERHPQNDLGDAVLPFLEKQSHSSPREITLERKTEQSNWHRRAGIRRHLKGVVAPGISRV
jgi:hypothetical protein